MDQDFVTQLAAGAGTRRCFAARPSGLTRSTDGGRTWASAYAALALTAPLATSAVVCSPDFAADGSVWAAGGGAILRSADGGQNWEAADLPRPAPYVSALAASPALAQDGCLFAATLEDGCFVTTDRGRRWSAWNFGLVDRRLLALAVSPDFARDQTVWAGAETGLFCSRNAGRSWQETALPAEAGPVLSLAAAPGRLFVGTESGGLLLSTDAGAAWRRLGGKRLGGATNALTLLPTGEVAAVNDDALWRSPDGGRTWASVPLPEAGAGQPVAITGREGGLLVGLSDGRVILA